MKIHFLLLVYLTIFRVQCTETPSNTAAEGQENVENTIENTSNNVIPPFYPHNIGIMNHKFNCYMNSVFACLYNIPFFQDTVYRIVEEFPELPAHRQSTLMSLADIFAKMRLGNTPVSLIRTMFPAIRQSMNWKVGEFECALQFWGSFAETMPERFKEIFQAKATTNYMRKSDGQLLKSIPDVYNYISIPIPSEPVSISSIMANQFLDEQAEDYCVFPSDQKEYGDLFPEPLTEKLSIPVKSTVTFTNKPNVFIFGVRRLNYNVEKSENELNGVPVLFDRFVLDGEYYAPVAYVLYNREHYYAVAQDMAGKFCLHNDTKVGFMDVFNNPEEQHSLNESIARRSVLAFYVKLSSVISYLKQNHLAVSLNQDIPACLLESLKNAAAEEKERVSKRKLSTSSNSKKKKSKQVKKKKIITGSVEQEDIDDNNSEVQDENVEVEKLDSTEIEHLVETETAEAENSDKGRIQMEDQVKEPVSTSTSSSSELISDIEDNNDENLLDFSLFDPEMINELAKDSGLYTEEQVKDQIEQREMRNKQKEAAEEAKRLAAERRKKRAEILKNRRARKSDAKTVQKSNNNQEISHIQDQSKLQSVNSSPGAVKAADITGLPLLLQNRQEKQGVNYGLQFIVYQNPQEQHYNQEQVEKQQKVQQIQKEQIHDYQQQKQDDNQPQQQEKQKEKIVERMERESRAYQTKLLDPSYILGRENFTFSYPGAALRSLALELVLTALASNSVVVRKFFSLVNDVEAYKLENIISYVLVQMLIGFKGILLHNLTFYLTKYGKLNILDQDGGALISKVFKILTYLSNSLNFELMSLPYKKLIEYSELETDEPIKIMEKSCDEVPSFNAKNGLTPRPAKISGFVIDSIFGENRLRTVLNTIGLMFPVFINRFDQDSEIIENEMFTASSDYVIIGGGYYEQNTLNWEFFSNHFLNSTLKYDQINGGTVNYHTNEAYPEYFQNIFEKLQKRSLILFVAKSTCWKYESIGSREIPLFLAKAAYKKIKETIHLRLSNEHEQQQQAAYEQQQLQQAAYQQQHNGFYPAASSLQQTSINVRGKELSVPQAPKNANSKKRKNSKK